MTPDQYIKAFQTRAWDMNRKANFYYPSLAFLNLCYSLLKDSQYKAD